MPTPIKTTTSATIPTNKTAVLLQRIPVRQILAMTSILREVLRSTVSCVVGSSSVPKSHLQKHLRRNLPPIPALNEDSSSFHTRAILPTDFSLFKRVCWRPIITFGKCLESKLTLTSLGKQSGVSTVQGWCTSSAGPCGRRYRFASHSSST